jgi:N-acetylglucosamine kinase-like BadF-type ATPase
MLLIADSGSTKCDWRLVAEDKSYEDFKSIGINPFFHDEAMIESFLKKNAGLMKNADKVTAVFFYGAGCSSKTLKRIVDRGLGAIFTNAQIYVDHDLVAAALAVYDGEPCIACILGTGSNSCHFDGDIVREDVPALGYILGDEGSGSYFGKQLLRDFLYKKLPANIQADMVNELGLTKDIVIENVYMKPHANVYLASFMPFITERRQEPYFKKMIYEGLKSFIEIHVKCVRNAENIKSNFIGSVAYYHEDTLRQAAADCGIEVGHIIKKPIEGLYDYHIENYFSKIPFKP